MQLPLPLLHARMEPTGLFWLHMKSPWALGLRQLLELWCTLCQRSLYLTAHLIVEAKVRGLGQKTLLSPPPSEARDLAL